MILLSSRNIVTTTTTYKLVSWLITKCQCPHYKFCLCLHEDTVYVCMHTRHTLSF